MRQFNCIKTNSCVYIEASNNYLFDGVQGELTHKKGWVKVPTVPTRIEYTTTYPCNRRYELKYAVEGFEKVLPYEQFDEDADWASLYEYKCDQDERLTSLEFELVVIAELDNFVPINVHPKYKNYFIDELETHPVLLQEKPVFLSSEESYKIIREYIKAHINPKVARVTSDYDFCLTVSKIVEYHEKKSYKTDVSANPKKPRYEVKWKNSEIIECFKISPDRGREGVYNGYPRCEEFRGNSVKDLDNKINAYLVDLMEKINAPAKVCSCCNGKGIVE